MGCVPGRLGCMYVLGGGGWGVYQVGWVGCVYKDGVEGLGLGGARGVPGGLGVGCVPRGGGEGLKGGTHSAMFRKFWSKSVVMNHREAV